MMKVRIKFIDLFHFLMKFLCLEYDDFDHVGSLTDEPECISPTDAKQWIFDRERGRASLELFHQQNQDIQEEEDDEMAEYNNKKDRRDSENFQIPDLTDEDRAKLLSCMEEIRNIVGDTFSDKKLYDAILSSNYDFNKALDAVLNSGAGPVNPLLKKPKLIEVQKGWIFIEIHS